MTKPNGLILATTWRQADAMASALLDAIFDATGPDQENPAYFRAGRVIRWASGARAHLCSVEDPDGIRGFSVGWTWRQIDWRFGMDRIEDAINYANMALREPPMLYVLDVDQIVALYS